MSETKLETAGGPLTPRAAEADDSKYPAIVRGKVITLGSESGPGAARAARLIATTGRAVVLVLPDGEERLYRPAWANCGPGGFPYRVKCPRCRLFRRYPRRAIWCEECRQPGTPGEKERVTTRKSRAIAESNRSRMQNPVSEAKGGEG